MAPICFNCSFKVNCCFQYFLGLNFFFFFFTVQGLKPNTVGPLLSCAYSKPVACNIGLIHAISHLGGIRWYNLLLNGKKKT